MILCVCNICKPLFILKRKQVKSHGSEAAMLQIGYWISPVLAYPNYEISFRVVTHVASYRISVILKKGCWLIAFATLILSAAEKKIQ